MSAATRITTRLVQEWIEHFLEKNKDYNANKFPGLPEDFEFADILGVQGQFGDLWRKIFKLKRAMWDGEDLTHEKAREILLDLIGNCFLAIDMIDRAEHIVPKVAEEPIRAAVGDEGLEAVAQAVLATRKECGALCDQGHTFVGPCTLRKTRKVYHPARDS